MTNEEAINVLEDYDINFERHTAEAIAEAHEMAIKALEQQPSEDWNAVLDELNRIGRNAFKDDTDYDNLFDFISNLPNVKPQPKTGQQKTGHWIWCASSHKCSNCGGYVCFSHKKLLKYCPECGARMSEVSK